MSSYSAYPKADTPADRVHRVWQPNLPGFAFMCSCAHYTVGESRIPSEPAQRTDRPTLVIEEQVSAVLAPAWAARAAIGEKRRWENFDGRHPGSMGGDRQHIVSVRAKPIAKIITVPQQVARSPSKD